MRIKLKNIFKNKAMDIKKSITLIFVLLLLAGCSFFQHEPEPAAVPLPSSVNPPGDDAAIQLAEAATDINHSLTELNAMEKTMAPPLNCKCMPYPTSSDLCQEISIDWSGPIEPLLRRISWMMCYKLRIIGMRPAIPVLVTISATNTPVGYVIRDANFQAATKASVFVYPGIHVIELRYGRC
jgi:defect in organelle trafficking protein DotD